MATESNVQSPQGVRTYRGRTLEEILPQIREELGPDAIILREREGLVGGVGGFFAQRFIEVEARRGDESEVRTGGSSIDIYDEDDESGFEPSVPHTSAELGRQLLEAGGLGSASDEMEISAARQTPTGQPAEHPDEQLVKPPEPTPFVPPEVQRERIIPRDPQGEPEQPTRSFETDVFLERLREASQILPDDEDAYQPTGATPTAAPSPPTPEPELQDADPADELAAESKPRRPARRTAPERKPRGPQPRRPRAAPRGKAADKAPEPDAPQPQPGSIDPWTVAMAALVAEPAATHELPRPNPPRPSTTSRNPYDELRQRPPSLRAGLPTEPGPAPAKASAPAPPAPAAAPIPTPRPGIAALEISGHREGGLRGVISRLFGGRFGSSTLPRPYPPRPIDDAAASAIAAELSSRGASPAWIAQLISTAAAHGAGLSGSLLAGVENELARRIVPAPSLPDGGAAVAFIGAGGAGKTRCAAALASAYSRSSTLGVTVIAVDNPGGARELKHLLGGEGIPVLSLNGERARQAVAAYREGGIVIIDTPTSTPTDAARVDALGASLAPLELDASFVALPATLGSQAARRALSSFGRLNPTAVAITHADETDHLAVVVEIAITNRIPLAYFHAGSDHRRAMSPIDACALARQLLGS